MNQYAETALSVAQFLSPAILSMTPLRERSLFMTGVGTEDKMIGQLKKLRCARWGRRIIADHRGSVRTYKITLCKVG